MKSMNIGIIGCGNMGAALVENLKRLNASPLWVYDVDPAKEESLVRGFGVTGAKGIDELAAKSRVIIVAVKPQDIEPVLRGLAKSRGKLIVSIAAGIPIEFLQDILGSDVSLVRAMPNLNALVGQSVTALSRNAVCTDEEAAAVEEIFKSIGKVVTVPESQMDAVTAISGSGPAFVAYLSPELEEETLERVMTQQALAFGMDPGVAKVLAQGTIAGTKTTISVNFDRDIFIKRVASKGGTTEAGLKVLREKGKTAAALAEAIQAARQRARELARRH